MLWLSDFLMKERLVGLARTTWMKIIHRDDATGAEKEILLDGARMSPPMSRMYAFLHPSLMDGSSQATQAVSGKNVGMATPTLDNRNHRDCNSCHYL